MKTKLLILPTILLFSCSTEQPYVQPPRADSDSTPRIAVTVPQDSASKPKPNPVNPMPTKDNTGYVGLWKCAESFCSNDPWTISIAPNNGHYMVTVDRKNDNMENRPSIFPAKYEDGTLVEIGGFGDRTIFFETGSSHRIHYMKWIFIK